MTLTERPANAAPSRTFAEGAKPPRAVAVRRRNSRGAVALAVGLLGAGTALGVVAVQHAGAREQVLVLVRDVPAGAALTDADLASARQASDPALSMVPASQRAAVVGRYAAGLLTAGSTLTLRALTTQRVPAPGTQLVAVLVKPGQAPARGLVPGDRVSIVGTPGDGDLAPLQHPVEATVHDQVTVGTGDGASVIDLIVADADAPAVARAAASGHVAVIELPASS
jgi:hypothetical protein